MFPWLLWYLSKARNDKCFNNKDISPLDTLQVAGHEASAWKMEEVVDTVLTTEESTCRLLQYKEQVAVTSRWRCQADDSWMESSNGTGLGFVMYEFDREVLVGQRKGLQTTSPLYVEAESLYWVMKEVQNRGIQQAMFESDCQQLVHIIKSGKSLPMLEPELDDIGAIRSSFDSFDLRYISRSLNVRADTLAKDVRSREVNYFLVEVKDHIRLAHVASMYETI